MYEGEWAAGKRHGFGRLVHRNGVVIAGDWLEGKQHGTAVRHPAFPGAGADRCHLHTTRRGPAIVVRHLLVKVAADTRAGAHCAPPAPSARQRGSHERQAQKLQRCGWRIHQTLRMS